MKSVFRQVETILDFSKESFVGMHIHLAYTGTINKIYGNVQAYFPQISNSAEGYALNDLLPIASGMRMREALRKSRQLKDSIRLDDFQVNSTDNKNLTSVLVQFFPQQNEEPPYYLLTFQPTNVQKLQLKALQLFAPPQEDGIEQEDQIHQENNYLKQLNEKLLKKVERLEKANSDLNNLLENTGIATIFLGSDLRIRRFSPAIQEMFGLNSPDLGESLNRLNIIFGISFEKEALELVVEAMAKGQVQEQEIQSLDGRWYQLSVSTFYDYEYDHGGAILSFINITELKTQIFRFETLAKHADVGIMLYDTEGYPIFANPKTQKLTGLNGKEALQSELLMQNIHPDDMEQQIEDWQTTIARGRPLSKELRWLHDENKLVYTRINITPVKSPEGNLYGFVGTMIDLTKERILQHKNELRDNQYRKALNMAGIGSWYYNAITDQVIADKNTFDIHNPNPADKYQPNLSVDRNLLENITHPDDIKRMKAFIQHILQTKQTAKLEWRFLKNNKVNYAVSQGLYHEEDGIPGIIGITQDVTDKKLQQLRQEALLKLVPVGIFQTNQAGETIYVNERLTEIHRVPKSELLGRNWINQVSNNKQRQMLLEQNNKEHLSKETYESFKHSLTAIAPDGGILYLQIEGVPLFSGDSQFEGYLGSVINLTTEVRLRKQIERRELRFQGALNAGRIGTWVWDIDREIMYLDESLSKLLGIDAQEGKAGISRERFENSIVYPEDIPIFQAAIHWSKHLKEGGLSEDNSVVCRYLKGNETRWMRISGVVETSKSEGDNVVLGIARDISKEIKKAQKIKENEARLKSIFSATTAHITFIDLDGNILYSNREAQKGSDHFVGKRFYDIMDAASSEKFNRALQSCIRSRNTKTFQNQYVVDKETFTFSHSLSPVMEEDQIKGVTVFSNDVSSVTKLKSEIRKAMFSIEKTKELILWVDNTGKITFHNEALSQQLGYSIQDMESMHFDALLHPSEKNSWQQCWQDLKNQLTQRKNLKFATNEGNPLIYEASSEYVFFEGEEYAIVLARDISERLRMQEEQQQRMQLTRINEELSKFAYVASHDLQEPLRTIMGFTQRIQKKYRDRLDDAGIKQMDFIIEAVARMNQLIKGILDYSRLGRNPEITTINTQLLVSVIKKDLSQIITDTKAQVYFENLPTIEGFHTELRLLFQNLLTNAIKFRRKDVTPNIQVSITEDQQYWIFCVADNGIGIKEQHQKKIFEIFQRLHRREEYEGTGIGLAQCKRIVDLHHGRIWVESVYGEGSKFFFTIPKDASRFTHKD